MKTMFIKFLVMFLFSSISIHAMESAKEIPISCEEAKQTILNNIPKMESLYSRSNLFDLLCQLLDLEQGKDFEDEIWDEIAASLNGSNSEKQSAFLFSSHFIEIVEKINEDFINVTLNHIRKPECNLNFPAAKKIFIRLCEKAKITPDGIIEVAFSSLKADSENFSFWCTIMQIILKDKALTPSCITLIGNQLYLWDIQTEANASDDNMKLYKKVVKALVRSDVSWVRLAKSIKCPMEKKFAKIIQEIADDQSKEKKGNKATKKKSSNKTK